MVHEDYVTDLERTGDNLVNLISAKHGLGSKNITIDDLMKAADEFKDVRDEARGYGRF